MKKIIAASSAFLLAPLVAFAQVGNLGPIQQLLGAFGQLVAMAIPILLGVAMLYFIWAGVKYIKDPKDDNRKGLIAGVIAFAVIVSIWGIVRFAQITFLGGGSPNTIQAPRFPTN